MGRLALLLFLVFAALLVLRALRLLLAAFFSARTRRSDGSPASIEGEMVRDPICGTWIDRRLALAARSGEGWVPVCSEECRARAAAGPNDPGQAREDRARAKGT
jgi:hypothetical protein